VQVRLKRTKISNGRRGWPLAPVVALISLCVATGASAQQVPGAPAAAAPITVRGLAVRIDTLLDLPSVISRAQAASPVMAQAEEGLRVARSQLRVATGAYLPSLSANSAALRSNVLSSTGGGVVGSPVQATDDAYSAGLSSSLELFTGGRRGAEKQRASADLAAATATDRSQTFAISLLASRSYYEALRGADLLAAAASRVTRAERGLKYAQDRVRAGTATKSDELRARLELTGARQQQLAARDTLQSAAFTLGRVVGADVPIGAKPPATLDPRPLALSDSAVVQLAVTSAPSVEAAQAVREAGSATVRASKTLYLPNVRVTGGYNWARESAVIGAVRPGWQVALGTTLPLFNGFQREDAVTRAEATAHVARASALDVQRQVRSDAARLVTALHFAEENVALAEEAVRAAQEDLRVQTERYRAGISTVLDELTSQVALTQAELGRVAARYNYAVTRASLEALVGRTL
jgi:outer membrane protein TolC